LKDALELLFGLLFKLEIVDKDSILESLEMNPLSMSDIVLLKKNIINL